MARKDHLIFKKLTVNSFFSDLRDTRFEKYKDQEDLLDIEFEGIVSSDGEAMEDYSSSIFMFIDLWADYLNNESLVYYRWFDVDVDCFWESKYNVAQSSILVIVIFFLLFSSGLYFSSLIYLVFALTWACYEDEVEEQPFHPSQISKQVKKYIKAERAMRRNFKKQRAFVRKFMPRLKNYEAKWRALSGFYVWGYNSYLLDDLSEQQWWFVLGRWLYSDERKSLKLAESRDLLDEELVEFYNDYLVEVEKLFYKIGRPKGFGATYLHHAGHLSYYAVVAPSLNMPMLVVDTRMVKNIATDYELHVLSLNVKCWYLFKNLSPKTPKKHNYFL